MKSSILCFLSVFILISSIICCPEPKTDPNNPNVLIPNPIPQFLVNPVKSDSIVTYKFPSGIELNTNSIDLVLISGQIFNLSIPSNPSTGYSWHIHHPSGEFNIIAPTINTQIACEFLSAPVSNIANQLSADIMSIGMAGAPGTELWTFQVKPDAKIAQKAIIALIYNRVWMQQPDKPNLTINIVIGSSNTHPTDIQLIPSNTQAPTTDSQQDASTTESSSTEAEVDDAIDLDDSEGDIATEQEKSEQLPEENEENEINAEDKPLEVNVDVDIEARRRRRRI